MADGCDDADVVVLFMPASLELLALFDNIWSVSLEVGLRAFPAVASTWAFVFLALVSL
jgi:hypothetical protein